MYENPKEALETYESMFKDLLVGFTSANKFPASECTIETDMEDVFDSDKKYLVVIVDNRLKEFRVTTATPYILFFNDEELYGWMLVDYPDIYITNVFSPAHPFDHDFVVAFRPL